MTQHVVADVILHHGLLIQPQVLSPLKTVNLLLLVATPK